MESHITNELMILLPRRRNDKTLSLVHIILSDSCLTSCGINISDLKTTLSQGLRAHLTVETQTRRHATGECSNWKVISAVYVPSKAIRSVIIPSVPKHPTIFQSSESEDSADGGLFVSLPIVLDHEGRYDAFDVVAIRITMDREKYVDILFTYDELLPPGTMYRKDDWRLRILCKRLCAYISSQPCLDPRLIEIGARLDACLSQDTDCPIDRDVVDSSKRLQFDGAFDSPQIESRINEDNREIMSLIRRAAEVVNKKRPIRSVNSAELKVASGLRQGVRAYLSEYGPSGTTGSNSAQSRHSTAIDQAAMLSGLEPPGETRYSRSQTNYRTNNHCPLEDVLMLTGKDNAPLSSLDLFDMGMCVISGGDTPADLWKRRAISIVPRRHYTSGKIFVIVSYALSEAWGGQADKDSINASLTQEVMAACASAGVDSPNKLCKRARADLVARFPALAGCLLSSDPPLRPFDISAETIFANKFHTACIGAIAAALMEVCPTTLRQVLRYDISCNQRDYMKVIADTSSDMIESSLTAFKNEPLELFMQSALAESVLASLCSKSEWSYQRYFENSSLITSPSKTTFKFDYFSAGGGCIKVSKRPIPVIIIGNTNGMEQCSCEFQNNFSSKYVCERYLPGECYAYICFGFNHLLDIIIVLPGGFTLSTNLAKHFNWPDDHIDPILTRFCRRVDVS
ncbi:UL17 [anatid alphaherpesvirus 1]|uniref:UL17 n=2 Tax=anatid alphaherpesvirus 1 TaxID=104388 RepID=A2TIU6_9ALPH|nr:UL17 [Anatid alphaherpesvirus 1]AHD45967.1 UL17 [BAC cloning vector pDEV-vac]QWQ49779.1 UL17 [BAC cloning vector pDEV-CHa]ABM92113.1 UL17-like protein [Anatid alphaherpesvirus 1]ABU46140.1 UL17 protein [Anatid alphaherpesvirus 1]ACT83559.1 UL17 [Anatid alphaherpesvirus 1]